MMIVNGLKSALSHGSKGAIYKVSGKNSYKIVKIV